MKGVLVPAFLAQRGAAFSPFPRQALGERARMLGALGRLVDIGGEDPVGLDPGLLQEFDAPRRA
jgi:hypothetical protein